MTALDYDDKLEGLCKLHVESLMSGHSQRRIWGTVRVMNDYQSEY